MSILKHNVLSRAYTFVLLECSFRFNVTILSFYQIASYQPINTSFGIMVDSIGRYYHGLWLLWIIIMVFFYDISLCDLHLS